MWSHPEAGTIIGKTNNVRSIYEDSKENIWVGLKNGELYVYDSGYELEKTY
ncbi:MAG: two-component regulator propeller domain-containing protein [Phocaeicola vulgatus]